MFFRGIRTVRHLGYNETPVHGHYTTVLRKISLSYIRKNSTVVRPHIAKDDADEKGCCCWNFSDIRLPPKYLRIFENVQYAWFALYNRLGGEWILLTTLGIVVAIFSFIMDIIMEKCNAGRRMMFDALTFSMPLQYFVWVLTSIGLVCFATGFTHLVGPFAIGSGIPEVKTIMRGVPLNEYLTFRTLLAKVVGLSTALGSGIPIGKEGPFVHVASISASLLSKLFSCFRKKNMTRNAEILAAACAVGVACTFAAPIGGVLFSIEVTATYFSVKNYWRGFYSAFVGAFIFRFLAIWFHEEVTLTAYFRTNLARGTLFVPGEILPFTAVGIIGGLGGVLFIYTHKRIVLFVRNNKICKSIIKTNRFIYPSLVTLVVLSLFFPSGFGQYMGGMLTNPDAVRQLFSNITWHGRIATNYEDEALLNAWRGPLNNVFVTLFFFFVVRFLMCAVATTLPIPAGIFIPSFTLGAGMGRLIGEVLVVCFPDGIGGNAILPGGYAIVGAVAFAGSVTHTVSTVVIAFEMTGQIGHVLPCIVAVLIACVISKKMTLSIFDVIVEIKKLPFLPGSINASENVHSVTAKEFMIRDVVSVTENTTYRDVEDMLDRFPYMTFPIIKSKENKMLIGAIHRHDLDGLLNKKLSLETKLNYFNKMNEYPQKTMEIEYNSVNASERYNRNIMDAFNDDQEVTPKAKDEAEQPAPVVSNDGDSSNEYASPEDLEWLEWQLNQTIDLSLCSLDPAPFQLVDKTSLFKVHEMFSLLSLQHAFVTKEGRLVGIISVNEVRSALEREMNSEDDERELKVRKFCTRYCISNDDQKENSSKELAIKANDDHK